MNHLSIVCIVYVKKRCETNACKSANRYSCIVTIGRGRRIGGFSVSGGKLHRAPYRPEPGFGQRSTFFAWVDGQSMKDDGINDGDLLVIRKTPVPADGDICVCFLNGEFTLKRVKKEQDKIWLLPSNKKYKPIEVHPDDELTVWGKVLASINLFVKLW